MSIPRPTNLPVWATTGITTEPSLPEKQTGWTLGDPPLFDWMNWHQNAVHNWITYLDDMIPAQPTTGYGYKNPINGTVVINPANGACNIIQGGWAVPAVGQQYVGLSNASNFIGYIDISSIFLTAANITAKNVTITSIDITTKWVSGNYSITLEKFGTTAPNLNPAATATILGVDATNGKSISGIWQGFVITPNELIDPLWSYRLVIRSDSQTLNGDVAIHSIIINYTKDRVE